MRTTISLPLRLHQYVSAEIRRRQSIGQRADFSGVVSDAIVAYRDSHYPALAVAEDQAVAEDPPARSDQSVLIAQAKRVLKQKTTDQEQASRSARK